MAKSRRSSSSRRSSGSRGPKAERPLPFVGPGERLWVLDIPYGTQVDAASWHPAVKTHLYVGRRLPAELEPYRPGPYTLGRFVENTLNPDSPVKNPEATDELEPRQIQFEGADVIAARAEAGGRQFLLADEPGVGKTITAVLGATAVGSLRGAQRVLVVADRPAAITIGHWCRTITALGDGGMDWVVITWDRLEKVAAYDWDVIIADEAHALRRTTTKRWKLWAKISGHSKPHDKAPFVIATTATPGHTPLELPYLAPAYAQVLNEPMSAWYAARQPAVVFGEALERHGIGIEEGRYGGTWSADPARRAADLKLVRGWLADERPPAMLHRAAPWGPVPISGMPVTLDPAERAAYEAEWGEFCREMDIARRGRNTAKGRAALLRFRQKAGLIRVDSTVAWIAQQVAAERQVACSVEFVATAADPIADRLRDAGLEVATIYGQDRFDPEAERLRFQTGKAKVCVFTTVASISLHAGETLADGRQASTEPRVGVFHQARFSGIAGRQVTGRTHRDHQVSPWHIAYAEGTVEEQVGKVMVERIAAASDTVGGDTSGLVDLAGLLGADWLPSAALVEHQA
ncbi:DEAD/DEAH box helicase family protein [Nocardioides cavernaquae]|uniref:Helicase n=1 Tax=Nocardioides cavernaquae TaxID=2321396 RepID=A0A3A5H849_9ACTN|nr:DEAD/DEAH box helicase family protein [Nocardioides cavernaquae]RJS46161.1 helicase [Nocardioides cavernaquae]